MPSYGSLHSPSVRKMESGNGYGGGRSRFQMSRIIGDPFALATISISILAWLIAFISSVISSVHGGYPNYSWWTLVFMFFAILGVLVTVAFDAEHTYHVAVSGRRLRLMETIC
jgi:SHO1 osmosensor